jgi:hypothetical protein
MHAPDFPPPPPAAALFRELSSAAVDAELARLARSWSLGKIEERVGAFKPGETRKRRFTRCEQGADLARRMRRVFRSRFLDRTSIFGGRIH